VEYLVRKALRVGGRADAELDRVLDEGMDAVHELVSGVVGEDPAVTRLQDQARAGEETERLQRRAADAIADAMEDDPGFAAALTELVNRLEWREADQASRAAGGGGTGAGQMGGRDALAQHAETGGVNITGGVTLPPAVILRSSNHRSQDHAGVRLGRVWGRRTAQPYRGVRLCRERLGWSAGQEGAGDRPGQPGVQAAGQ
jgi:hypothetical protein